jgi:hypothetical protein
MFLRLAITLCADGQSHCVQMVKHTQNSPWDSLLYPPPHPQGLRLQGLRSHCFLLSRLLPQGPEVCQWPAENTVHSYKKPRQEISELTAPYSISVKTALKWHPGLVSVSSPHCAQGLATLSSPTTAFPSFSDP